MRMLTSLVRTKFLLKCIVILLVIGLVQCEGSCRNCLYGEEYCDPNTKVCTFGCKPGWRNDRCDQRCIVDDCRECTVPASTIEECTSCDAGFYGPLCNLHCGDKCNGVKGFDTCDHGGNCLFGCKPPYSGAKCQDQDCPFKNCKRCDVSSHGNTYCWQCDSGYHWDENREQCVRCSEYCKNGPRDCDSYTGTCPECKNGWFGSKCLYQCNIANCTTCAHKKDQVICKSCNNGMYPEADGFSCKPCDDRHCIGECSRNTGECFNGCQKGWFGKDYLCDRYCTISNCEICSLSYHRNVVCSKCNKDYYVENKMCAKCPATCRNSCEDHSSDCVGGCLDGYYGDQCEMRCNPHCLNNTCVASTGHCDCEEGWYGYRCDRDCPIHCIDCPNFTDGICASCEPGRFGPTCESRCSRNCRPRSYGGYIYCDKDTGACEQGCINGAYGDNCNSSCNSNCESNVCDRVTGNCLSGCTQNYFGPMCQYPCPENCRHVVQGYKRTCDAIRGECLDGCGKGKYGVFCNLTCSDRCKEDMCEQSSGDCSLGCKIGYAGEDCDIICANNCPNDCSPNCKDGVCDKITKSCISGCNTGWYGTTCMNICSDKCVGRICEQINGNCVGKCIDGFYGASCNLHCSENCFDAACNKTTGFCIKGCKTPYHGKKCDESCPTLCMNGTCNQITGTCISCGIGKHGDMCDENCEPGSYGENCELKCGHCRDNVPCNIYTGDCLPGSGCMVGYTGEKCMKALYSKEETVGQTVNMDLVIGCCVAAVICIIILSIVVVVWLKSRKLKTKTKCDEPVVVYRDANVSIERTAPSGDRGSNQSTHSDMMLLGDTSSRLQINLQQEINKTNIYTLYKGQINTGARKHYCCVKLVKLKDIEEDKSSLSKLMRESELHTLCCSHVNVVNLITSYQNTDVYCVAFDNSIETGLTQYLQNLQSDGESLEPDNICRLLQFTIDICSALCHIQTMKIIHRMVQLKHIYVSDTLVAKLGDFYWANNASETDLMIELPEESYPWWSPEVLLRQHFTYQSDVWSFGVTFWEIFSLGKQPFQDVDKEEYKTMILDGIRPSKPQIVHLTKYRVMKSCWRYTPEDRPTAEQILQQLIDIQSRFSDVERVVVHV
ncbi:multiple epidermal growth factor-like domains protein 6 [Ruditapes philippinarum]|uniref:multiple epidermal growth factor-like domains protein 6 n=1 Tax=Ruditapes philippinarum TaxID=129788 RepID=UPI00295B58F7|nr:multiple epidermal growth factor-like domains protein 6 [Ruditapes philippinarum]